MPSSIHLSVVKANLRMEMGSEKLLSNILEPLREQYDFILIDTNPSLGPCIVKDGLSYEEALMYVVETNVIQRSFTDMLTSKKAAVLAMSHSKLFLRI